MKNFLIEAVSTFVRDLENLVRHIFPGFFAVTLYKWLINNNGISAIISDFTVKEAFFAAFLGIMIYAIHKVGWNLIYWIRADKQTYTQNQLKHSLLKAKGLLVDINYQWALLHLLLMSAEIILFMVMWKLFAFEQPRIFWMGLTAISFALVSIWYYAVLSKVMTELYVPDSANDQLMSEVDRRNLGGME